MPGEREQIIPRSEYLRVKERLRRCESEKMGLMMEHSNLMQDMDRRCLQQRQEIQRLQLANERLKDENEELISLLNAQPEENGYQQHHDSHATGSNDRQHSNPTTDLQERIQNLANENRLLKEICTYLDNGHPSNLSNYPPLSQASLELANGLDLTSIPKRHHDTQINNIQSPGNHPPLPASNYDRSPFHHHPPPSSTSSSSSSKESNDPYDQTASVSLLNHSVGNGNSNLMKELKKRISSLKQDDDDTESIRTEHSTSSRRRKKVSFKLKDDDIPKIKTSVVENGNDDVFTNPLPPPRLRKSFSSAENVPRSGILRKSTSLGSNEGYLNSRSLTPSPNLASNNSSFENIPTPVVAKMNNIPRMLPKPTIVNGTSRNTQVNHYYTNNMDNYANGTDL